MKARKYSKKFTKKYKVEIEMIRAHKEKFGDQRLCDKLVSEDMADNWPRLTGTTKQITWASKIRRKLVHGGLVGINELMDKLSSSWWIENRRITE